MDVLTEALGIEVEGIVTTDYTGLVTAMGTGKADLGAFGPLATSWPSSSSATWRY